VNLVFRRILVAAWVFVLEVVVLMALFPRWASTAQFSLAIRPVLILLVTLSVLHAAFALYRQNTDD
jgi:cytochrome bd-type quinol oxidase subunit 2